MDQVHTEPFIHRPALNEVEIDKAVEILNNAERPVIYAGYGGVKAGEADN